MSVKDVKYVSPVTGKEVSKATYYRHVKKHFLECETEPGLERFQIKSQSQSQSQDYHDSDDFKQFMDSALYQGKYKELQIVFKNLFLAASSRGIPKKIIQECEKFL